MPFRDTLTYLVALSAGIAVAALIRRTYSHGSRRVRVGLATGVFVALAAALVTAVAGR
jgi:hypothetical protein